MRCHHLVYYNIFILLCLTLFYPLVRSGATIWPITTSPFCILLCLTLFYPAGQVRCHHLVYCNIFILLCLTLFHPAGEVPQTGLLQHLPSAELNSLPSNWCGATVWTLATSSSSCVSYPSSIQLMRCHGLDSCNIFILMRVLPLFHPADEWHRLNSCNIFILMRSLTLFHQAGEMPPCGLLQHLHLRSAYPSFNKLTSYF